MTASRKDPYDLLGVKRTASDSEVRMAYRRLVQRHHPDHNGGSLESARRFEEVHEAYAAVVRSRGQPSAQGSGPSAAQPEVDARLADLERQVREARAARQRAEQAAAQARREAARAASPDLREGSGRASDEDLGYVTTEDSISKLIEDAWTELRSWFDERRSPD